MCTDICLKIAFVFLLTASCWAASHGVHLFVPSYGTIFNYNSNYPPTYANGDTWYSTWADDGNIYVVANDFLGWNGASSSNMAVSTVNGYTSTMAGTLVNAMASWGTQAALGSDNGTFKAGSILSVNGTLYVTVCREFYNSTTFPFLQTATTSQIIKSTNHGVTWTPAPPSTNQPYAAPMFTSANFSIPAFIQYPGQDYQGNTVDGSGTYVYAVSTDGFWNNGSHLYLGRVLISAIGNLSASDWSFYQGGDGSVSGNWGALTTAKSILDNALKLGQTAIIYVPFIEQYLMFEWFYPSVAAGSGSMTTSITQWDLYQSAHPWGPWLKVNSTTYNPSGLYNPVPVAKSLNNNALTTFTAGDFKSTGPSGLYDLTLQPLTLQ